MSMSSPSESTSSNGSGVAGSTGDALGGSLGDNGSPFGSSGGGNPLAELGKLFQQGSGSNGVPLWDNGSMQNIMKLLLGGH